MAPENVAYAVAFERIVDAGRLDLIALSGGDEISGPERSHSELFAAFRMRHLNCRTKVANALTGDFAMP